jgi:hypothetical protein
MFTLRKVVGLYCQRFKIPMHIAFLPLFGKLFSLLHRNANEPNTKTEYDLVKNIYPDLYLYFICFINCMYRIFVVVCPRVLTNLHLILSYEAEFYKPTILKVHPLICIKAHVKLPNQLDFSSVFLFHAFDANE